jgi:hypothetical protein
LDSHRIVSQGEIVNVDTSIMTTTTDRIYNKACNMCDRPASTFDRDNRAFCPQHASIFLVRAQPVEKEVPAATSLSGWPAYRNDPVGRSINGQ